MLSLFVCVSLLAGCAGRFPLPDQVPVGTDVMRPEPRPDSEARTLSPTSATPEQFDTTTPAERAAASAPSEQRERQLGKTLTTLGNPSEPGFWLKTPLVDAPMQGRVVFPSNGNSVAVDLIPIDGPPTAGSRISLPAMRLLGAPLAGVPELVVFAG